MDNLKLAHERWGNDSSLKAKRNIAYAELYACCLFVTPSVQWQQIHMTKALFGRFGTEYPLTKSCIDALNIWLEGIWSLYSQTRLPLFGGVFCNNLISEVFESDIERQIQQLNMSAHEAFEIENLYHEYKLEIARAKRAAKLEDKIKKTFQQKEAIRPVVADSKLQASAKRARANLVNDPDETTGSVPEKPIPEWWVKSVSKKQPKVYPMPEYLYRRRDRHWIEQKIADYGCLPVLSRCT